MIKSTAILILCCFLLANTAFRECLRLPILFHHYAEHSQQNGMSFFDFLASHYEKTIQHPDDEHNDHQNLPFKSVDSSFIHTALYLHTFTFELETNILNLAKKQKYFNSQPNFLSSFFDKIWQPPKA